MKKVSAFQLALLLFAVGLAVRLLFFPFEPFGAEPLPTHGVTFDGYYEIAENLMQGNGYTRDFVLHTPDSMRTPLYPFFIVALVWLFGTYKAVFVAQLFIGSLNVILAWLIARHFLSVGGALAVGLLVAFEPYTAKLTGLMLTETLFTGIFLGALLTLLQFLQTNSLRLLALSSALFGVATLVRPTTQYIPALVLLALAFRHQMKLSPHFAKQAAVVIAVFFVCIAPWAVRNYVVFGTSELSAQAVSNAFFALTSSAISLQTGAPYLEARAALFEREGVKQIDDIHLGTAEHFKARTVAELQKYPSGLGLALATALFGFFTHDMYVSIVEHFGFSVSYSHPGVSTLVTNPALAAQFILETLSKPEAFVIFGRVVWILTTMFAFAGGILYLRRNGLSPQLILIAGCIAYFAVTSMVLGLAINGRFRVPVNPLIFIFAVYAVQAAYHWWQKRSVSSMSLLPEKKASS